MKATFEKKLAAASASMKLNARKALKHPIPSILSLCVFAGIAATVALFSQTNDKAIAPTTLVAPASQTLPVTRTLTSTDGRTIDVTILSKSSTAIKAKKADGKEFEIALDKLSDTDKTFVAELVAHDPNVVKKTTVLVVVDWYYKYPEYSEFIKWLKAQNMEVTIGLLYDSDYKMDTHLKTSEIPNTEKAILLDQPSIPDAYDIVWIPRFSDSTQYQGKYAFFEITNHLLITKRIMVVSQIEELAQLKYLVSYNINVKAPTFTRMYITKKDEFPQNFVRSIDNVVFYNEKIDPSKKPRLSKEEAREKLIKVIKSLLPK